MTSSNPVVRDLRHKEKFVVDDVYLNGYSRHCGIYATGVYMVLCRHADKEQTSFPSVELIAEKLKISERSVIRAIKTLEAHNIIKTNKRKSGKGTFCPNLYILLDRSEWKPNQVTHSHADIPQPGDSQSKNHMTHSHPKVSHTKDTQYIVDFETIWKRYPVKDGKKVARKSFDSSVKNKSDWQLINKALDNYLAHLKVTTWKTPKNGSTWFNNWQDWIDREESTVNKGQGGFKPPCSECGSTDYSMIMGGRCGECR